MDSFRPSSECTEKEHKCKNSYGNTICVRPEVKNVACAVYPKNICADNNAIAYNFDFDGHSRNVT